MKLSDVSRFLDRSIDLLYSWIFSFGGMLLFVIATVASVRYTSIENGGEGLGGFEWAVIITIVAVFWIGRWMHESSVREMKEFKEKDEAEKKRKIKY